MKLSLQGVKKGVAVTLILLVVALAGATVAEKLYGSEWAHRHLYGSAWFLALWICLTLFSCGYMVQQKLWRRPSALLLHGSLMVILAGALLTWTTADKGYMHVRQGETTDNYISEKDMQPRQIPFDVKLVLFDIEYHPGSDEPADYISFLKVDGQIQKVSMNKISKQRGYRLCQYDYDPDEMGTTLLVNYDPLGVGVTYSGYIMLAISMLWMLWLRIGWLGMLLTFVPTAGVWFYISQINPMTPVLRTPMLAAHVSVIMVAYGLFVYMMVTGIIGLCSKKLCDKLAGSTRKLLYPALFLLAAGIFIGAVWANVSWGRYWGWDAKETWALITLLVYAVPLHTGSLPAMRRPRTLHWYCAAAFLAVAMTFFGVTYILGGIHSYVQ